MNIFRSVTAPGKLRFGLAFLAVGALAACDPVPQGDTSCESAYACEVVGIMAKTIRADIGTDFGGGVVLRNIRALGQVLVMDVSLPFSNAALAEPAGQDFLGDFAGNLAGGFCSVKSAQKFFDSGGKLRARGFSTDNTLVADKIVVSCRGIKQ